MLLITICCAWVLGIFLGSLYHFPWPLMLIGIVPVPFAFAFKKLSKYFFLAAFSLVVIFGAALYYPISQVSGQIASFNNEGAVELKGSIEAPPDVRDNTTQIELSVQEVKIKTDWQKSQGKILLFTPRYPEFQYGDVLLVKGYLEDPPQFGDFDYQAYLSRKGILSTMLNPKVEVIKHYEGLSFINWVYAFRENLSRTLFAVLPEPQASLAQGIVLGLRSTIPDTLRTNLSLSGTAHLLAISGINLSIIAGIVMSLGIWLFGRRHYVYVWMALLTIWFYSLITGMQAPVIRSAIMTTLFLFAELLGRQKSAVVAIALAAAIMVGFDPQLLWSISFQLTFMSMVGLIFISPLIRSAATKVFSLKLDDQGFVFRTTAFITDSFSVTLGALIAVWPIIAYNFKVISLIGPLATFLIAPALPPIIALGALAGMIGLLSLPIASLLGWVAWIFLTYMLWLVNLFASLPMAAFLTDTISLNFIRVYYSLLGIGILWIIKERQIGKILFGLAEKVKTGTNRIVELSRSVPRKLIVPSLLVAAFLTSLAAATLPDKGNLRVSFLDVGEGDSILIQTGHQNILIDGGPSAQAICERLSNHMPFWDRDIDMIVLSHPHIDHMTGLIEVLRRYRVHRVMAPDLSSNSPSYLEWLNLIEIQNIEYTLAQAGQKVALENGAFLEILNPPYASAGSLESDLENNGLVMRLSLDKVSFLFTADMGQEGEGRLISRRADVASTVLKVAHHGSSTSSAPDFLDCARPQVAVISVGAENTFGHPDENTMARLIEFVGSNGVYRTDKSGSIEFTTNGQQLWVKTQR